MVTFQDIEKLLPNMCIFKSYSQKHLLSRIVALFVFWHWNLDLSASFDTFNHSILKNRPLPICKHQMKPLQRPKRALWCRKDPLMLPSYPATVMPFADRILVFICSLMIHGWPYLSVRSDSVAQLSKKLEFSWNKEFSNAYLKSLALKSRTKILNMKQKKTHKQKCWKAGWIWSISWKLLGKTQKCMWDETPVNRRVLCTHTHYTSRVPELFFAGR